MKKQFYTLPDISSCFIQIGGDVDSIILNSKKEIQKYIDIIKSCNDFSYKSFDRLFGSYDRIIHYNSVAEGVLSTYTLIGTDALISEKVRLAIVEFEEWYLKNVTMDEEIYVIIKKYFDLHKKALNREEYAFAKDLIDDLENTGVALSADKKKKFIELKSELSTLMLQFDSNVATSTRGIWVKKEEAVGLSDDFISTLKCNEEGLYFLGVDYPTNSYVMRECKSAKIRQALLKEFTNRGYPENVSILDRVRELRMQIAQLLGYENFAEYDCFQTVAQSVDSIRSFCDSVAEMTKEQAEKDKEALQKKALNNPCLLHENVLSQSDVAFILNLYIKENYNIDQEEIAQYFPVSTTLDRLFALYGDFFEIDFNKRAQKESWWWSDDLIVVDICEKKSQKVLGTILFDLYPRANKYTHACHNTIIHSTLMQSSVAIIVANFPAPTDTKESLLKFSDVTTFFHELGHGLHALFGATRFEYHSGTRVKLDFVEVPSQMFELWMEQPEIIKEISCHYQTKQSLSDDMIHKLIQSERLFQGLHFQRQVMLSLYSLNLYSSLKDSQLVKEESFKNLVFAAPQLKENNFEYSFCHLMGYGAKYYSYLWSLVYAIDLFCEIKKRGFKNPLVGKEFKDTILLPGGSENPLILIKKFLGRQVRPDVLKDYLK